MPISSRILDLTHVHTNKYTNKNPNQAPNTFIMGDPTQIVIDLACYRELLYVAKEQHIVRMWQIQR